MRLILSGTRRAVIPGLRAPVLAPEYGHGIAARCKLAAHRIVGGQSQTPPLFYPAVRLRRAGAAGSSADKRMPTPHRAWQAPDPYRSVFHPGDARNGN